MIIPMLEVWQAVFRDVPILIVFYLFSVIFFSFCFSSSFASFLSLVCYFRLGRSAQEAGPQSAPNAHPCEGGHTFSAPARRWRMP